LTIKRFRAIGVLLCASFLAACATPYQPAAGSWTGGFGEKRVSDSAYWVYFAGNGHASQERVSLFWLNRCAELTIQQGYQYMVLRPGDPAPVAQLDAPARIGLVADKAEESAVPAVYHPGNPVQLTQVKGGGGATYTTVYAGGGGIVKWSSKGTVLMYHAPLPKELIWSYDAQKVLDVLKGYVSSDGESPAPTIEAIMHASMVAHEEIGFALTAPPIPVVAPESPATPDGTPKPPRGDAEIDAVFNDHSIAFHTLFQERERTAQREDGGSVNVSFSVTPNGSAVNCRVASTTFPDQAFADAVAQLVCKIAFPPRDVAQTEVPPVVVTFTPLMPRYSS